MVADRLFSDEELTTLARSPWVTVREAIEAGEQASVEQIVADLEAGFRSQIDRFTAWIASITAFAVDEWGHEGAIAMTQATREFFAASPDIAQVGPTDPAPVATEIAAEAGAGDRQLANERFDALVDRWRPSIDLHRDWISALLGCIYRGHGPDTLEAVLRRCGEQGLMGSIERHVQRSPEERLVDFVRLLHGHFAELNLLEDEEKFTIEQDPCGTCSRQILDGRYGPPLDLAVVEEAHAVTWGRGTTTIYRSHVPIWHVEMAREQLGVPWPVNQCPHGLDAGVCRILLYKDPYDPRAAGQVPGPSAG